MRSAIPNDLIYIDAAPDHNDNDNDNYNDSSSRRPSTFIPSGILKKIKLHFIIFSFLIFNFYFFNYF